MTVAVFNHTGQVVTDLERATTFYEQALGFSRWFEINPPDDATAQLCSLQGPLGVSARYLTLGDFTLELIHYAEPNVTADYRARTMNEPGLTHLSIAVDDVRSCARRVVEYGGSAIEQSNIGVGMLVRDPEGQLIELLDRDFRDTLPPRPGG